MAPKLRPAQSLRIGANTAIQPDLTVAGHNLGDAARAKIAPWRRRCPGLRWRTRWRRCSWRSTRWCRDDLLRDVGPDGVGRPGRRPGLIAAGSVGVVGAPGRFGRRGRRPGRRRLARPRLGGLGGRPGARAQPRDARAPFLAAAPAAPRPGVPGGTGGRGAGPAPRWPSSTPRPPPSPPDARSCATPSSTSTAGATAPTTSSWCTPSPGLAASLDDVWLWLSLGRCGWSSPPSPAGVVAAATAAGRAALWPVLAPAAARRGRADGVRDRAARRPGSEDPEAADFHAIFLARAVPLAAAGRRVALDRVPERGGRGRRSRGSPPTSARRRSPARCRRRWPARSATPARGRLLAAAARSATSTRRGARSTPPADARSRRSSAAASRSRSGDPRPRAGRRARARARDRRRPRGWRSTTSGCGPRCSPSSRTCAPRAPASSRRATPRAAASSATSTTARSSDCSRSPTSCGSRARPPTRRRRRARGRCSRATPTRRRRRSTSCASWLTASTRRSSPRRASGRRLRRSPTRRRCRSSSAGCRDERYPERRRDGPRTSSSPSAMADAADRRASHVRVRHCAATGRARRHVDDDGEQRGRLRVAPRRPRRRARRPIERRRRRAAGGDPMRVVVAEDMMLTREGIVRLLTTPASTSSGRPRTPTALLRRGRGTAPGRRRSSTSRCRRPTPTRASSPRSRSAPSIPRSACSCSRTTSSRATRCGCSRSTPSASATCSRSASSTSRCWSTRCAASPTGETVIDPTIVSRLLGRRRRDDPLDRAHRRASARCSALVAEGLSNRAIAARLFVTERTVEAHIKQIFAQARPRRGRRARTAACWPCSRCCAPRSRRRQLARFESPRSFAPSPRIGEDRERGFGSRGTCPRGHATRRIG